MNIFCFGIGFGIGYWILIILINQYEEYQEICIWSPVFEKEVPFIKFLIKQIIKKIKKICVKCQK